MTNPEQWSPEVGTSSGWALGLVLGRGAWKVIRFVRADYARCFLLGQIAKVGGFDVKSIFALSEPAPAKKLAYARGTNRVG